MMLNAKGMEHLNWAKVRTERGKYLPPKVTLKHKCITLRAVLPTMHPQGK